MNNIACGIDFARALGEHFSLPPNTQADILVNAGASDLLSVTVKIVMTADDLAAIAQRMPGATPPAKNATLDKCDRGSLAVKQRRSTPVAPGDASVPRGDATPDWLEYFYPLMSMGFYKRQEPASEIGFDAWMRARTDAAHAAYMAGHAAGGVDYPKYATGGIVTGMRLVGEAA